MADEMSCLVCKQPVEARQNVLFQVDGGVVHVTCFEAGQAAARVDPGATADPTCRGCSKPIRHAQSIVKIGAGLFHADCLPGQRLPIAGEADREIAEARPGRRGTSPR
jgi:hypothetical protein